MQSKAYDTSMKTEQYLLLCTDWNEWNEMKRNEMKLNILFFCKININAISSELPMKKLQHWNYLRFI